MDFKQHITNHTLDLHYRSICVKYLVEFLQKNPRITHLDLSECKIGIEGIETLAKSQVLKQLKYLNLNYNLIGNEGAVAIAQSKNLVNIEQLFLDINGIGDEGAKALAKADFLNLKLLTFGKYFSVGNEAIKALAEANFPKLTSLTLCVSSISCESIEALAKSQSTKKLGLFWKAHSFMTF